MYKSCKKYNNKHKSIEQHNSKYRFLNINNNMLNNNILDILKSKYKHKHYEKIYLLCDNGRILLNNKGYLLFKLNIDNKNNNDTYELSNNNIIIVKDNNSWVKHGYISQIPINHKIIKIKYYEFYKSKSYKFIIKYIDNKLIDIYISCDYNENIENYIFIEILNEFISLIMK